MYATIKSLHQQLEAGPQDIGERIALMSELAFCYLNTDPGKCKDILQDMMRLSEAEGYDAGIAEAHNGLARLYLRTMNHEEALAHYHKAVTKLDGTDNYILQGKVFDGMGMTCSVMGQTNDAIDYFNRAIICLEKAGDADVHAAKVMNNLGNAWFRKGELESAENIYRRALEKLSDCGERSQGTFITMNLGILHNKTGRQDLAMPLFYECLDQFTEKGHKLGMAGAHLCLGRTYLYQRDYAEAMEYITEAMVTFKQLGNQVYLADSYCTLGEMYLMLEGYAEAEEQLQKARDMFTEIYHPEGLIEASILLSKTWRATGKLEEADKLLEESLQLAQQHGMNRYLMEEKGL